MALTDHIGTLLQGSFDRPAKNRLKPQAPSEYYAVVAFPPAAAADLASALAEVAPGGNWKAVQHAVKPNNQLPKPFPGIPDDHLVVRFGTQFAVEIRGEDGAEIIPTAENSALIRSKLFAGQRVRINGGPYLWNFQGKPGISWNLCGAMAVGGGERRPGGNNGGGFEAYIPKGEPAAQDNAFTSQAAPAQGGQQQPAQGGQQSVQQGNGNPFQQGSANGGAAGGNPFA